MRLESTPIDKEDVRFKNGEVSLAAELWKPANERQPFRAAIILQGSGSSDRTNSWAREIASILSESGLAVLLTDKRGSGASGGDWRKASFMDLAGDIEAAVAHLRSRSDIDGNAIGIVGLSQGGRVASVVAQKDPTLSFAINISGSAVRGEEQLLHELRNDFQRTGISDAEIQTLLETVKAGLRFARTGDGWEDYRARREHLLKGNLKAQVTGFPSSPDEPMWEFWRLTIDFDPLPAWQAVRAPVLILYGSEDEKDNVPVASSVARLSALEADARRDFTVIVLDGVGHSLRGPDGALHPTARSQIVSWLTRVTSR